MKSLPESEFSPKFITFSANTTANETQKLIMSHLDQRSSEIHCEGSLGFRKAVFFVDDLNMPTREIYGAQPPIELMRQYLDHQQW